MEGVGDATRLILIRHGEAQVALDGVVGGHEGCRGLSSKGVSQADALCERLQRAREFDADFVASSVLPRAVETADRVAPALGNPEVARDCELCELHPGEADGVTWAEYRERYGFDMRAELERPIAPGGESLAAFQRRVEARISAIARERSGQTSVLFCHGGVITATTLALLGAPGFGQARPFRLTIANTSITEWLYAEANGESSWELVRFNDTAHLRGPAD